jgi:hypothetical protein
VLSKQHATRLSEAIGRVVEGAKYSLAILDR